MADQEIAKHTKNIWRLMSAEHPFWHKVREMLLEIVIIVFAVSMSIWLHSIGEHRHEQAQVKTFLLGLKRDIQIDIAQVGDVLAFHHASDLRYAYLASLDPQEAPDRARFNAAYAHLNTNSYLMPRVGRYEGFKSSGKLTNIENDALLEKIVNLYEYDLPKAALSSSGWEKEHRKLIEFADLATAEDNSLTVRYKMATSAAGKRNLERMVTYSQLYERYKTIVDGGKAIIAAIDKAYPEQVHAASAH